MKTNFLLLLFIVITGQCYATHYRSAEICHKYLGNYTFEITVVTYSKYDGTSGMADADSVMVEWGDGNHGIAFRSNGPDVSPANGIPDGEIIAVSPLSIRKNEYTAVHTYPGLYQYYIVGFFDMNRIDGINNIDNGNSVNVPLYVTDSIFINNTAAADYNTSPVFLQHPVQYAFAGQPFTFNSTAYDADGDSLHFEPMVPLQDKNLNVPLYQYPDQYCPGNDVYTVNAQNGQINWINPCQSGIFNVAVKVREYRCGALLSVTMRDLQIIVIGAGNTVPQITSDATDTIIQPGELIQFAVSVADNDSAQTITLVAYGGAFSALTAQPVFTATPGNPTTGNFSWLPDVSSARKHPYIFSILATDNFQLINDVIPGSSVKSFRVWVADTTACLIASDNSLNRGPAISLFPNPSNSFISVTAENKMEEVVIFDVAGRKVSKHTTAARQLNIPVGSLTAGMYIVAIRYATHTETIRFVKSDD